MSSSISINNATRAKQPRVDFLRIKRSSLGKDYKLSVIFVTAPIIRKLNRVYRGKDATTDILSFPLFKNEGEIYICPIEARKEAKKFERPYDNFIAFLFIHGCMHLKGYDHGGTMERLEKKLRRKFGI
jgi:probable rRNA maturation factor